MKLIERFKDIFFDKPDTRTKFERLCDAVDEVNDAMAQYRTDPSEGRLTFWIERTGTGPQQIQLTRWSGAPVQVHP